MIFAAFFCAKELTNLSILSRINALDSEGRLIGYVPSVIGFQEGPSRQLWLTRAAHEWCFPMGRHPDGVKESSLAAARAQLDHFVRGSTLLPGQDMKHLDPYHLEVWTIRTFLDPKVRLFGWFVQPRTFIVVHGKRRDQLERSSVGPKWNRSVQKVVEARLELFPGIFPYSGFSFGDYVG